jgi:hypothetical protein
VSFGFIFGGCMGGFYYIHKLAEYNGSRLQFSQNHYRGESFSLPNAKITLMMIGFFIVRFIFIVMAIIPLFQFILLSLFDKFTDQLIYLNKKRRAFYFLDSILDVMTRLVIFLPYMTIIYIPVFFIIWSGIEVISNFATDISFMKGLVPDMLYYYAFIFDPIICLSAVGSYVVNFLYYTFDLKTIRTVQENKIFN